MTIAKNKNKHLVMVYHPRTERIGYPVFLIGNIHYVDSKRCGKFRKKNISFQEPSFGINAWRWYHGMSNGLEVEGDHLYDYSSVQDVRFVFGRKKILEFLAQEGSEDANSLAREIRLAGRVKDIPQKIYITLQARKTAEQEKELSEYRATRRISNHISSSYSFIDGDEAVGAPYKPNARDHVTFMDGIPD